MALSLSQLLPMICFCVALVCQVPRACVTEKHLFESYKEGNMITYLLLALFFFFQFSVNIFLMVIYVKLVVGSLK